MKNKIIVSLLLVLLLAISASAVSASEDMADAITETPDTSDIELINEDVADTESISENLEDEDMTENNVTDDTNKLGDVNIGDNPISVNNTEKFTEYVGTGKTYGDGTTFNLDNNYIFNLTNPQDIKVSCTIKGGTIKAENLDCFFNIESPANGGPSSVTIKNTKFIITKNQSVVFAKAIRDGYNNVLNIAGITLENITFEIADGVSANDVSLLYIDTLPVNNAISNAININNCNLNGAHSINIANALKTDENPFELTEIIEIKTTRIVLNTNVIRYAVDKAVGDSAFPFEVKLIDQNGNPVVNQTVFFIIDDIITATTDSNGVASIMLSLCEPKDYYIYSQFRGYEEYSASEPVANTIRIIKKVSSLSIKNLSYKVTAAKKLTATFRDQNKKLIKNKKVTFTVNGKTYSAKTNSKGVATVKITLNKKGTYTYSAKFAGDSIYTAVTKKAKLTVVPLATSLTTKKYTFKKAAKTKKISVTLKSGKTVLKSQKITLKVNGKTYTAKTNSKGIATVKIALNKKGTFKYTAKYAGNNKYKAVSKANKVIIK